MISQRNSRNVLLVEDDDDHAQLMLRQLQRTDSTARVVRLRDGVEALDYLQRVRGTEPAKPPAGPSVDQAGSSAVQVVAERPNLILLDLNMPGVDGFEVLDSIKQDDDLRVIPVIMLTSSDEETDRLRAYRGFVNGYLVKPDDAVGYRGLAEAVVGYWHRCNRMP